MSLTWERAPKSEQKKSGYRGLANRCGIRVCRHIVLGLLGTVAVSACGRTTTAACDGDSYRARLASGYAVELIGGSWENVSDVARASTVAIATVTDERALDSAKDLADELSHTGEGEPFQINRLVTLRFEQTFSGGDQVPSELKLVLFGWEQFPNGDRKPLIVDKTYPIVGDRVFILLTKAAGHDGMLDQNAMLFLKDGCVIDTTRDTPAFKELEGISEGELITRVKAELAAAHPRDESTTATATTTATTG